MRLLSHVSAPLEYRLEVSLAQRRSGPPEQRAWDAVVSGVGRRTGIELEMRLRDAQALERRLNAKRRDDPLDGFLLALADTGSNRQALRDAQGIFSDLARLTIGTVTRALREGRHPPSGLVLV